MAAHPSAPREGPEAGRERFADEDSGITWVDFTDIIQNAAAGEEAAFCRKPSTLQKKGRERFPRSMPKCDIFTDKRNMHIQNSKRVRCCMPIHSI